MLDAGDVGTRNKKQFELGMKAIRIIKLFSDLMICFIIESKFCMKFNKIWYSSLT